jgi:hypothetical protein
MKKYMMMVYRKESSTEGMDWAKETAIALGGGGGGVCMGGVRRVRKRGVTRRPGLARCQIRGLFSSHLNQGGVEHVVSFGWGWEGACW